MTAPESESKEPETTGRRLAERRLELGWSQERLSEEIRSRTDSSLSTSAIKKIEQGRMPISKKTQKLLDAIPELGFGGPLLGGHADGRIQLKWEWMPDCNPIVMDARATEAIRRGVVRDNYDPRFFSPKGYQHYSDHLKSGQQFNFIESRNRVIYDIRTVLVSEKNANQPIDIISLTIGYGSPEIELATYLSDNTQGPVSLYIVSNSIFILNAFRQRILDLNHCEVNFCTIFGQHESIDTYRDACLFNPRNRRILFLPSVLAHHQANLPLLRALSRFASADDLMVLDVWEALGTADDLSTVRSQDPRLNGTLSNSPEETTMKSLATSVLELFPGASIADYGTDIDLPRRPVSSAEYLVSHYLTLAFDHERDCRIIDMRFVRYSMKRLLKDLDTLGWRLVRTWNWGNDVHPRYPGKLLLLRRY